MEDLEPEGGKKRRPRPGKRWTLTVRELRREEVRFELGLDSRVFSSANSWASDLAGGTPSVELGMGCHKSAVGGAYGV